MSDMNIAVVCSRCRRLLFHVKPADLNSQMFDALCPECQKQEIDTLNHVRDLVDKTIDRIKGVEDNFVKRMTDLAQRGLASQHSQTLEQLKARQK